MLWPIQLILAGLLGLLAINFLLNLWSIAVVSPDTDAGNSSPNLSPLISILVPARNEANNIVACVNSLCGQTYQNLEIIVLDDQSSDQTAALVVAIAKQDSRVRLINGQPLPSGWVGKNWACQQLGLAARGEWLLFTDADTRFEPTAVTASLAFAERNQADLLSLLPRQEAGSAGVKLMIPLLYFTLYTLLPGALLTRTATPSISAAIGQFLLFRATAYRRIGGHQAVAASIVEDLALAALIKQHRQKLVLADGHRLLCCRMYGSLTELWQGFTKNFFASFSFSVIRLSGFAALNGALYLTPLCALILLPSQASNLIKLLWLGQLLIPYLIRLILSLRHPGNWLALLLHPCAIAIMIAISGNSLYRIISGRGVDWKGRAYRSSGQ